MIVARNFSFTHNDLRDLKEKLAKPLDLYLLSLSVYSMDGDAAHLVEIENMFRLWCVLGGRWPTTGVFGKRVRLCGELGIEAYARVHVWKSSWCPWCCYLWFASVKGVFSECKAIYLHNSLATS